VRPRILAADGHDNAGRQTCIYKQYFPTVWRPQLRNACTLPAGAVGGFVRLHVTTALTERLLIALSLPCISVSQGCTSRLGPCPQPRCSPWCCSQWGLLGWCPPCFCSTPYQPVRSHVCIPVAVQLDETHMCCRHAVVTARLGGCMMPAASTQCMRRWCARGFIHLQVSVTMCVASTAKSPEGGCGVGI
jgi:hypothetical protein